MAIGELLFAERGFPPLTRPLVAVTETNVAGNVSQLRPSAMTESAGHKPSMWDFEFGSRSSQTDDL